MPVPSFAWKIDELLRPCNGEERRSGRGFFGWKLHRLPPPDFMRVHIPMVQTEKRFYERVFTSISYSFTRLFSTRRRGPSEFNEWNLNLLVARSGSTTHVSPNCIDTWRVSSLRFFSPRLAERKERAKARKDVLDETGNEKGGEGCFTENWNSQHGQTVIFAIVRVSIALLARCASFPRSANIPIVSFRPIYRGNKSNRFLNVKSFLYLWILREFCTFLRLLISRKLVFAKSFNAAQNWSQISAV